MGDLLILSVGELKYSGDLVFIGSKLLSIVIHSFVHIDDLPMYLTISKRMANECGKWDGMW